MSARVSRGCLTCRTRRVKCDEGKPSCERCLKRSDVCTGYRDDATLLFRSENEKAATRRTVRRASFDNSSRSPGSAISSASSKSNSSHVSRQLSSRDPPPLSHADISSLNIKDPFPWAKSVPKASMPSPEDQAVSQFFERYVMYPCNEGSSPGFLEHLPSLFKDCQVEGRLALRWAVRAAAYGGLSNDASNEQLSSKALHCYGLALQALGEALADPKQAPDDYTLMTIVVLDLFESVYLPDPVSRGSHAGGMAHILRLRGPDQIYCVRGWILFRLSHHRLQKQQLAFRQAPIPESEAWLESLNEELPDVGIEKHSHEISKICSRARNLIGCIGNTAASVGQTLEMIKEMHELDQASVTWRGGPEWAYKTVHRSQISDDEFVMFRYSEYVQLHQDVWIAYEWNYHRTSRVILHEHLLECLSRLETLSTPNDVSALQEISLSTIRSLVDDILSTVPQSLGDIDHEGNLLGNLKGASMCKGIGGYFLLWPIKIIKGTKSAEERQKSTAQAIFERIRECTGMKSLLGDASSI